MKRVLLLCAALVVLGVPGAGATATAGGSHHAPRPDLAVSQGAVTLTGGTLTGSFSVKDKGNVKGNVKAKKSKAALFVRASGTDRLVATFKVKPIRPGTSRLIGVSVAEPAGLPAGSLPLTACADSRNRLKERSEGNNCRVVGTLFVSGPPVPTSVPWPT